ncbi:hypothetical protein [Ruminococcus sp. JL13D9]|uniref:hypothetical protein n=1 Tax=Ruminococcus sp. JL13D9 TaxID=3233381 RepID=UPI003899BB2B
MIKKYNFDNSANKKLMAEILSKRDRQPRAAFLSSLAAVMVAAISLTMVFGSLSTSAVPLEEPEQQTGVSYAADGETLPPEEVTRVHTETKTETVTVYNDTPQLSETLLVSDNVSEEPIAEGKSLFNQKKQIFQWQYKGEVFTFFVKDNTVYRRNETTGKTVVVFKGEKNVTLFCLNNRYLFFGEETIFNVLYDYTAYSENFCYCYRVDLLTGDILRLFSYYSEDDIDCYPLKFIRFDGSDVVFSQQWERIKRFVVHEDGSYEVFYDDIVYPYNDDNEYPLYNMGYVDLDLYFDYDNTITGESIYGIIFDVFNINDIESFGYEFNDTPDAKGFIYNSYDDSQHNSDFIFISFEKRQSDTDNSLLMYYGKKANNGYDALDGGFIQVTLPDSSEMILKNQLFHDSLSISYGYNDDPLELSKISIPVNFDKLTADTMSEPEYYTLENGETLTLTYYPCNYLHAATPDSAE